MAIKAYKMRARKKEKEDDFEFMKQLREIKEQKYREYKSQRSSRLVASSVGVIRPEESGGGVIEVKEYGQSSGINNGQHYTT